MKSTLLYICLIAVTTFALQIPAENNNPKLLEYKSDNNGLGAYNFKYRLSDDTEREENGQFEGEDNYVVRGYYTYTDPNGEKLYVTYYADKTGYHPTVININDVPSSFIPSVPFGGVPGAVLASLLG